MPNVVMLGKLSIDKYQVSTAMRSLHHTHA